MKKIFINKIFINLLLISSQIFCSLSCDEVALNANQFQEDPEWISVNPNLKMKVICPSKFHPFLNGDHNGSGGQVTMPYSAWLQTVIALVSESTNQSIRLIVNMCQKMDTFMVKQLST